MILSEGAEGERTNDSRLGISDGDTCSSRLAESVLIEETNGKRAGILDIPPNYWVWWLSKTPGTSFRWGRYQESWQEAVADVTKEIRRPRSKVNLKLLVI